MPEVENIKRGPGQPRKSPTRVIGIRVDARLAGIFASHVAPHHRRPWLESLISKLNEEANPVSLRKTKAKTK